MIQQIYITDYLSDAAPGVARTIEHLTGQCPMLLKADWQVMPSPPLNLLFNALHAQGKISPAISPVSGVLRARQSRITGLPALCLLPVHLGLQRDTFSLQGTIKMPAEVYLYLTDKLQQHFLQDFVVHPAPEQRFWWIQPLHAIEVECAWPQDCLYQQAFQWQPQGRHAALIRQWSNEIQMLLHQLSQEAALPGWPAQLNSMWFASVPEVPVYKHSWQLVYGHGAVFEGLRASRLPALQPLSLAEVLFGHRVLPDALMVVDQPDEVDWPTLAAALQKGLISTLVIVLPLAERSVQVTYRKRYRWQFWRKTYTLQALLAQLESALPAFKLPDHVA